MRAGDSAQLVGRALPGYTLGLTEEGEVLVAGAGLARGYLGLPEETQRRFVQWPLVGEVYLTGDLATWSSQGLRLRGRRDCQVKVSGVRVEAREVEEAVEASGLVAQCTCVVAAEGLVAHVVSKEMDWVLKSALEAHAAKRLPSQAGENASFRQEERPFWAS